MDPAGKTFANRSITNELALFIVEQFAVLATEAAGDIGPTALAEFNPPVETITFAGVGINWVIKVAVTVVFTVKLGIVTVAFPDPFKVICWLTPLLFTL